MEALLISDKEYSGKGYQKLKEEIVGFLETKGYNTKSMEIGSDTLTFCKGCFGCWIKKPGECVINDAMSQINHCYMNSDLVLYLSPIIFGQFSANIKNTLDRSIPNVLPFFEVKADGTTAHPQRYTNYPRRIIIGFGDGISEEDEQLFLDITSKHLKTIEILVHHEASESFAETLNKIKLAKAGEQL